MAERETTLHVDVTKTFKLNANTIGICEFRAQYRTFPYYILTLLLIDRVAYTPERMQKHGEEAAKPNGVFSFTDKMGLVSDAMVLARAGYAKTSSALDFISNLRDEKECAFLFECTLPNSFLIEAYSSLTGLVWSAIGTQLANLDRVWWEQPETVRSQVRAFRQVRGNLKVRQTHTDVCAPS